MKKTALFLAAAILLGSAVAARAESVRVGVIAEITGDMPAVGASCRNAAEMAVKEVNAAGGLNVGGKRLKVERLAYRQLRGAPRVSAIITALGVGIFLENFLLALNPYPRSIPKLFGEGIWSAGGLSFSSLQILIVVVSFGLMFLLDRIVYRTMLGTAMRAVSFDRAFVPLMGVPVDLVISATFAIGAGLAGAAGTLYAMAYPVIDPYMGIMVGWKAFIAAVIGGIGNIRGAMIGAFILGTTEIMVAAFLPSTYRDFVAFTFLLVLLVARPCGILGKPRVQKV